jgi:acetyl-CoA acetyltransferase
MSRLRGRVAIAGVGETPVGRVPDKSSLALHAEAGARALRECGIRKSDIDGLISSYCRVQGCERQGQAVAEYLGLKPGYVATWCNSGATGASMIAGAAAIIEAGLATTVLVTAGESRLSGQDKNRRVQAYAEFRNREYEVPYGPLVSTVQAMYCQRHMFEYGTTSRQLAQVAVTFRKHALLTGRAHMDEPLTIEDVLNSKMISTPYHKFDCALISDGGAAAVVTTAERAKGFPTKPVYLLGVGEVSDHEGIWHSPSFTSTGARISGKQAFSMSGLGPGDMDVAEIYDCFTGTFIMHMEDLGFCPKGEGGPFVEAGNIDLGGKIPCNTHGGLLSYAHSGAAGGLYHVIEAVHQLRGEGAARQVDGAKHALVQNMGGAMSHYSTLILGSEV